MFNIARRNPLIWVGNGQGNAPVIYLDDVVEMLVLCAANPNAHNETFNCVNDPAPTWKEFLLAYAKLARQEPPTFIGIPTPIAMGIAPIFAAFQRPNTQAKDAPALVGAATKRSVYKTTNAREKLGWQQKVSLAEGVEKCRTWLTEKGLL
jgi:nucleoside-diphosphate-sugar epimerase